MRGSRVLGRLPALLAIVAAVVAAAVLLRGGDDYRIEARFDNAGQLVKGNLVQVGGQPAGTVEGIEVTRDGQAEISLKIEEDWAPLRRGTHATVRQASLSGV